MLVGKGSVGITVSTSITTMLKSGAPVQQSRAYYRNLWGQGREKRTRLALNLRHPGELDENYHHLTPAQPTPFHPEARQRRGRLRDVARD